MLTCQSVIRWYVIGCARYDLAILSFDFFFFCTICCRQVQLIMFRNRRENKHSTIIHSDRPLSLHM